MHYDYQLLVIGSGPAGYVAAVRAAKLGLKVACVEKMDTLGGTCLNMGCIPSKALLHSSEHYAWLKHSSGLHGIKMDNVSIDLLELIDHKENIVDGLAKGIVSLFRQNEIIWFHGKGKFLDAHTVEVSREQDHNVITAENILIATGSEPAELSILPFNGSTIISSTEALCLKKIPKRLIVIGGGAIGVELASLYSRLGSLVTIVEMLNTITPGMDELVSSQLLKTLRKQGIEVLLEAKITDVKLENNEVHFKISHQNLIVSHVADVVLVAVGRKPYTKGLGLDKIGVETNGAFIKVNQNFQTSVPNIFAVGDVIQGPMLAHKASYEGTSVVEFIAGNSLPVNYIAVPSVVYTHPEAASVGFTEKECAELKIETRTGLSYFQTNARARCSGETEGFVKVIGEKHTGRLIGMHILGANASELINEGVLSINKGMTLLEIAHACHAHPTVSESIMEACQQAIRNL